MRISDWSSDVCSSDLKHPTIHSLMSGPWDIMMVFELPRGMAMLDSHNPPERTAWEAAFEKVAGSKEAAEKLVAEANTIETDRLVVRSEERRVGQEGVSTCRSRWTPDH